VYLANRLLWDEAIDIRNSQMVDHSLGVEGPNPRRLMYVYTDESYVNRNHSIG
jgi:hypothetical protein